MDGFESLLALGDDLSSLPGHASLPTVRDVRQTAGERLINEAVEQNPGNESVQVDVAARVRGWFRGDEDGHAVRVVGAYMANALTLEDTVRQLAEPIEHTYTTADGGRMFVSQEEVARNQRQYWSAEEAEEMWGPEEDLEALKALITDSSEGPDQEKPSTEGQLWDLYYTILHQAKKTSWRDDAAQAKLVDLVAALKARPDPPRPANATKALERDWIWDPSINLWSDNIMFGPSARESWNDSLGCGAGWHPVEVRAWTNVNAFVARITSQRVRNFTTFGFWGMEEALAKDIVKYNVSHAGHSPPESAAGAADALFKVAEVWVRLAGAYWYQNLTPDDEEDNGSTGGKIKRAKWSEWRRRFEEEVASARYTEEATKIARECAELMKQIEVESA